MPDIQIHPIHVSDLDGAIEHAADGLADSLTHGLHDKPGTMLVCVILWAISAPVISLWNAI